MTEGSQYKNTIDHIAIIMDGNGRWAKQQGQDRIYGHQNGVESIKNTVEGCRELGVKYMTLYAFSTENWERPKEEVNALMSLLVKTIKSEIVELKKNGIKLEVIGEISSLPQECQMELADAMDLTKDEKELTIILALSYSSRWEIKEAIKKIISDVQDNKLNREDVNDNTMHQYLSTKDYPDPELLIRTGGEYRISNFLLYQLAYTELHFTSVNWPDFRKKDLYEAVENYNKRERRFGKTSEQL